jgi:hypothetical protein
MIDRYDENNILSGKVTPTFYQDLQVVTEVQVQKLPCVNQGFESWTMLRELAPLVSQEFVCTRTRI